MENSLIKVSLIVQCKNMKSPKTQRPKFDQTLEAGFWQLVEHKNAQKHDNQLVTTTSEWIRDFKGGKKPKQIIKNTRNLLIRASEYADILELNAEITVGDNPSESFSHQAEGQSEYYKTKSWK
jgi:hypothetical protein